MIAGAVGEHLRVQGSEQFDDERRGGEQDAARDGAVTGNDYGGTGLGFQVCTTIASFTHVQFTLSGSSPGCDMELQIKTFDEQPKQQTPPGGCDQNAAVATTSRQEAGRGAHGGATVITVPLADFTKWSAANAAQVVGLQWQFTGTNVAADASCPIDVRITGSSSSGWTPVTPHRRTPLTPERRTRPSPERRIRPTPERRTRLTLRRRTRPTLRRRTGRRLTNQ